MSDASRPTPSPRLQPILWQYAPLIGALFGLSCIFALSNRNFLSSMTLSSILNSTTDLTIVSVGMTFVLILGGIDLSVGSVLALCSSVLAVCFLDWGWPLPLAFGASFAVGTFCGLVSGSISFGYRIPSFIVTLGMLEVARGATYQISTSEIKHIGAPIAWVSEGLPRVGISPAFLAALFFVLAGQWVLHRTVLGRMTVAIGTNAETVRMAGLSVFPYALTIFGISGGLCGLAAVIQTSRLESSDPNAGVGMELSAIAACVIGGTSLRGGKGSIVSTFFGVLIVAVLQTGLAQLGVTEPIKRMITGGVIIAAVLIDSWRSRNNAM